MGHGAIAVKGLVHHRKHTKVHGAASDDCYNRYILTAGIAISGFNCTNINITDQITLYFLYRNMGVTEKKWLYCCSTMLWLLNNFLIAKQPGFCLEWSLFVWDTRLLSQSVAKKLSNISHSYVFTGSEHKVFNCILAGMYDIGGHALMPCCLCTIYSHLCHVKLLTSVHLKPTSKLGIFSWIIWYSPSCPSLHVTKVQWLSYLKFLTVGSGK